MKKAKGKKEEVERLVPRPIELTDKVCATCAYGWKYGKVSLRCKEPSLTTAQKVDPRGHCVDWKPNAYVEALQEKEAAG